MRSAGFGVRGAVLLLVLALAACASEGADVSQAPPSSTPAPVVVPSSTPAPVVLPTTAVPTSQPVPMFEAEQIEDYAALCDSDEVDPTDAADYRGDGPHPIAVFERYDGADEYERVYIPRDDLPGFQPEEPTEVALLACLAVVETGLPVGTCSYQRDDGGSYDIEVDGSRYEVVLHALATGEELSRDEFVADFCPPGITYIDDPPDQVTAQMTIDNIVDTFDGYVNGSAR